jgi:dipeptidyl aminopeptidase/acylaminoacyl peptidase
MEKIMIKNMQLDEKAIWKQRFRAPNVAWTQIAPANHARGLAINNTSGKYQLYAWNVPSGAMRQLTDHPTGILFGALSSDGAYVYYLDDKLGNEIGHYVRVPFEGGEPQDISPDIPDYSSWGFTMSRAGNQLGFMAADSDGFHLYCLDVESDGTLGRPRQLYQSKKLTPGPFLSYGGEIAVVMSTERTGKPQYSLVAIDTTNGKQVAELWDGEVSSLEAMVVSPIAGDTRILAATNRTGIETLLIWDPKTGKRTDLVFEGPTGALRGFDWSPDGERIIFRTFNQAIQQLYIYHFPSNKVTRVEHAGVNFSPYFATNKEIWSHWQDPTLPTRLVAIDAETGVQTRTVLAAGDVPSGHPWKSVTFTSSDGQRIQAWLGLPDGAGPFPVILETHGGPEFVTSQYFSPESQAWLDHGSAFLTINYRGSTTFGREFQEKIWGNPGHWEVEDMVAGRDWLIKSGIAKPDQVFLTGWSYGGYLTLQALGKYPDLWAGGMAGIAIADWAISYEDSADTVKAYFVALFDGVPADKPKQYAASSPITYVENVKAPVLIIQGRNDTRTPARPVEMYEQRMKALGKPIEVHWFDAGHMGAGVERDIENFEIMLRFAYKVLG